MASRKRVQEMEYVEVQQGRKNRIGLSKSNKFDIESRA